MPYPYKAPKYHSKPEPTARGAAPKCKHSRSLSTPSRTISAVFDENDPKFLQKFLASNDSRSFRRPHRAGASVDLDHLSKPTRPRTPPLTIIIHPATPRTNSPPPRTVHYQHRLRRNDSRTHRTTSNGSSENVPARTISGYKRVSTRRIDEDGLEDPRRSVIRASIIDTSDILDDDEDHTSFSPGFHLIQKLANTHSQPETNFRHSSDYSLLSECISSSLAILSEAEPTPAEEKVDSEPIPENTHLPSIPSTEVDIDDLFRSLGSPICGFITDMITDSTPDQPIQIPQDVIEVAANVAVASPTPPVSPSLLELCQRIPLATSFINDGGVSAAKAFDPGYLYANVVLELQKLCRALPQTNVDPYSIVQEHCETNGDFLTTFSSCDTDDLTDPARPRSGQVLGERLCVMNIYASCRTMLSGSSYIIPIVIFKSVEELCRRGGIFIIQLELINSATILRFKIHQIISFNSRIRRSRI
ncbi:hypothetical protein M422DRAFT_256517 [Sphaerobolus stellatus SS14]|uniref:Uncharacterized protein n=1 Tax=Sphaerobolus stellatus (strain SS14) TaxID=990650 RepID=A0A0C9VGI4_SPHS4|nr:hypothetical protein M422DRAFT_256517 [Sphaerobolus stellatus SS14]